MKQKTAMMHLIEELRMLAFSKNHLGLGDIRLTQGHIDEIEEHYLKKEKEQIMQAYNEGLFDGSVTDINNIPFNDYYNQKYLKEEQ